MDELITKRSAVSRISDLLMFELKGKRLPTWNEVYNAIGDIPPEQTVIHCKDCKWFGKPGCSIEIVDDSDRPTEKDFCSFAEREEDGKEDRCG